LQSSFAEWRDLVRLDVRSLYALARATENDLKQTGRAGGALFAAITARGGAFGLQPNGPFSPTHFAVADFTKTLALEFTGVLCKVVDLDPTDPNPILRQKLIDELTSPDDTLQVGLPGDRRLTVCRRSRRSRAKPRQIQRDWVFLVTGGARGVTAEIARQLAERYQPTLILAGASPLPSGPEPADTAGITEMPRLKAALTARLRASSTAVKPAAGGSRPAAPAERSRDRPKHRKPAPHRRQGGVSFRGCAQRRSLRRVDRPHLRASMAAWTSSFTAPASSKTSSSATKPRNRSTAWCTPKPIPPSCSAASCARKACNACC
jgi:NAD(P)-dependent dehydrogenase (short-subunit alcohol dehydrogenase family)